MPDDAQMRCLGCGYDLRELPEHRCPECGREFDPANRETYDLPRTRGLRWAVAAWTTLAASIVLTVTTLLGLTHPTIGLPLVVVALVILVRSGAVLFGRRTEIRRADAWLLAFAAALVVVLGAACGLAGALSGNLG